jgi:hypothetical protein
VVNSLIKPDCPVLAVLIPLQVLLNFRIAYSPPFRQHKGTFNTACPTVSTDRGTISIAPREDVEPHAGVTAVGRSGRVVASELEPGRVVPTVLLSAPGAGAL